MELRQEVARAIAAYVESDEEEWQPYAAEADSIIARCGPRLPTPEDEAWRVAQIAATLTASWFGQEGTTWTARDAIDRAKGLLAESRRQVAAATEGEG